MRPGHSFEDTSVAGFYAHRPEYPRQIFDKLIEISPGRSSLLDLGCGTGKIVRGLAPHFASVTGLDASREMLRVAQAQPTRSVHNITWICGLAETAELTGEPFDLVVAAASIHWMDHAVVFPRLRAAVGPEHVFAVVDGDGAFEPPWQDAWDRFLERWIFELKGEAYEPRNPNSSFATHMSRYRDWVGVAGELEVVSDPIAQSVDGFIACQHSRETFAPSKLGVRMREFDEELARILQPYEENGTLTYTVKTRLTWGSILPRPRQCPG